MGASAIALFASVIAAAPCLARDEAPADTLTLEKYFQFVEVSSPQISPDGKHVVYIQRKIDIQHDRKQSELWSVDVAGGQPRRVTEAQEASWSADSSRMAYLARDTKGKSQIFVLGAGQSGPGVQLTSLPQGVAFVPPAGLRYAFWNIRWSPDGKWIAFRAFVADDTHRDIGMPVPPPGAQWTPAPRIIERFQYRADRIGFLPEGWVHLFIVPAAGGTPRQLTHGRWNVGVRYSGLDTGAAMEWTPDSRNIVFDGDMHAKELALTQSQINIVATDTAEIRQLTQAPGIWSSPTISPDGKSIAFTGAEEPGDTSVPAQLWVMGIDGSNPRQITHNLLDGPQRLEWARDGKSVLFNLRVQGTENLYAARLNGSVAPVTTGEQVLHVTSYSGGRLAAGTYATSAEPDNVVVFDVRKAHGMKKLTELNHPLLEGTRLATTEGMWYSSLDGSTKVQGWIVKPPDFDPQKKYPLILDIHGGPHAMYDFKFDYSRQNFAANGYVVLYTNPRGSTGYGGPFSNVRGTFPGQQSFDDLMGGVDEVIRRGYVDTARLFVTGCSAGATQTLWLIEHTDRFAAASAQCSAVDPISMMGMTDMSAMLLQWYDTPFWEDSTAWLAHSPLMHVGSIKTPTLLMNGTLDMRTPSSQSEALYAALKVRGIPARLVYMNGEGHGTRSIPSNFLRTQLLLLDWWRQWSPAPAQE